MSEVNGGKNAAVLIVGGYYGAGKSIVTRSLLESNFRQLKSHTGFELSYRYVPEKIDGKETGYYIIKCFDGRLPRARDKSPHNVFIDGVPDPLSLVPEDKKRVLEVDKLSDGEDGELISLSQANYLLYSPEYLDESKIIESDSMYEFHNLSDLIAKVESKSGEYRVTGKIPSETSYLGYGLRCYRIADIKENRKLGYPTFMEINDPNIPEAIIYLSEEGISVNAVVITPTIEMCDVMLRLRDGNKAHERQQLNRESLQFKENSKEWQSFLETGVIIPLSLTSRLAAQNIVLNQVVDGKESKVEVNQGQFFSVNLDGAIVVSDNDGNQVNEEVESLNRILQIAINLFPQETYFNFEILTDTKKKREFEILLVKFILPIRFWIKRTFCKENSLKIH